MTIHRRPSPPRAPRPPEFGVPERQELEVLRREKQEWLREKNELEGRIRELERVRSMSAAAVVVEEAAVEDQGDEVAKPAGSPADLSREEEMLRRVFSEGETV